MVLRQLFPRSQTADLVARLKQQIVSQHHLGTVPDAYRRHAEAHWVTGPFADFRLERFLVDRCGDVDITCKDVKKAIQRRNKHNLWMCVIADEEEMIEAVSAAGEGEMLRDAKAAMKCGCVYLQGEDMAGRPNVFCKLRKIPVGIGEDAVHKGAVFVSDEMERSLDEKRQFYENDTEDRVGRGEEFDAAWNVVMDGGHMQIPSSVARKIGMNVATSMILFYPERGHRTVLIDPDWVTKLVLMLVQPFLDDEKRQKISTFTRNKDFLAKRKTVPELAKLLHDKWIDVEYGGAYNGAAELTELGGKLPRRARGRRLSAKPAAGFYLFARARKTRASIGALGSG